MPEQAGTLYGTQGIEREIYQPLSQAVQQGKTELDLSLSQPIKSQTRFLELCRQALTQVRRDYPESFLDNHTDFTYYYNQNGYYRVVYQLGYLKLSDQQKQSMTDEVEKIVRQGKKQCSNTVQLLRVELCLARRRLLSGGCDLGRCQRQGKRFPVVFGGQQLCKKLSD